MTHSRGVGGSAAHDLRREGTVTPPEHNLGRPAEGGGTAEAKLANPDRPHSSPSAREERRAAERAAKADGEEAGDEEPTG